MQIKINENELTVYIQNTKRTSMDLSISPEGLITVKVPKKTTESEIVAYVLSKSKQILKFQEQLKQRTYVTSVKTYDSEENYMVLGKVYKLNELLVPLPCDALEIPARLKQYYMQKTKEIITKRLPIYEAMIGVKAKGFKIVDSPKSWGTCNSNKQLTFNYKLSMAHLNAIDYVIIHELCHIMHLNHDRSFWRKVGTYDKDYKKHQDYLAYFGAFMTI